MIALALLLGFVYFVERYLLPVTNRVLETKAPAKPAAPEPMPVDLVLFSNKESEAWARDAARAAILEAYEETRDWNAVRQRVLGST